MRGGSVVIHAFVYEGGRRRWTFPGAFAVPRSEDGTTLLGKRPYVAIDALILLRRVAPAEHA